jgi:hypothetical protein
VLLDHLTELAENKPEEALALQTTLASTGAAKVAVGDKVFDITKDHVSFVR